MVFSVVYFIFGDFFTDTYEDDDENKKSEDKKEARYLCAIYLLAGAKLGRSVIETFFSILPI
jgi:hypothetical protein